MPKTILLVEDFEDDAILFKLALNQAGVVNSIITVATTEEAISYLLGDGPYADRTAHPLPTVICVDLKLNGRDGLHLLGWLNIFPQFNETLVIVLSGYHELKEVRAAYGMGADSFLSKPIHPKDVENLIRAYPQYWDFKRVDHL
ncbi:response regulator [Pedosphaera parvula]|uniref:Response regulator receiver protein n=1 Tax=Pedosphaera parvula (strain Ellin514) TaxID=320771 RepID=B9XJL2_PEDPL|nr:response regulator [Pedosphaera parvula]EEF59888.1 response regulator receiver protein [Pedosphaera parvula Ellin514]